MDIRATEVTPHETTFQRAQRLGITACIHSVDFPTAPLWSTCSQAVPTPPRCEFFVIRYMIPSYTLVRQVQLSSGVELNHVITTSKQDYERPEAITIME
jgi:hypothetical protein